MDRTESHRCYLRCRVNLATPQLLDDLAEDLGLFRIDGYGDKKGNTGALLDKIANGELRIVCD